MTDFSNVFRRVGGEFNVQDKSTRFWHPGDGSHSMALRTDVHPGFMTGWQQPLAVALTQATGISIVHETVYEKCFGFTRAFNEMGVSIQTYRGCLEGLPCRFRRRDFYRSTVIQGPTKLRVADIGVPDLRGGFSRLVAALAVEGGSIISGIDIIDHGYGYFMQKLKTLGANVVKKGWWRRSRLYSRAYLRSRRLPSPTRSRERGSRTSSVFHLWAFSW